MILYYIFSFPLGLCVGSFLNVVILRSSRGESFIKGRSRCESCKKTLAWFELIPLASFALQKGRCRSCGAAISWQYPLVEFLTGVLFTVSAWLVWGDIQFVVQNDFYLRLFYFMGALMVISSGVVIAVSDIRWQIIPNGAVLIIFVIALIREFTRFRLYDFLYDVGAAFILAFFFFALWFFSKGAWLGFGDVKLIFASSLLLGFPASVVATLFSFWIGGILGVFLLVSRIADLKTHIPFGPFILAGSAVAYFYSKTALWYIGMSMG